MTKLVKITNLERLLTVLRDGNWHSADELAVKISHRFGHTIFEARQKGYLVEKRQVSRTQFEYRLLAA